MKQTQLFGFSILVLLIYSALHTPPAYGQGDGVPALPPDIDFSNPDNAGLMPAPPAPVVPEDEPSTTTPTPYGDLRDPFWPVGFTPAGPKEEGAAKQAEKEKPVEEPKWEEATKLLDVKGVMNAGGGKYVAMINNQVVKEGDEVAVKMGSLEYRWKIRTISSRGARFEPLTAERPQ